MSPNRSPSAGGWSSASGLALLVTLAVAAGTGIAIAYSGRVDVGLHYDDYHLMRPWSPGEWRRAWLGSWDPTGIEPVFYRPLTAALYAVRFHLFALNATAMHVISVAGHGVCALLVGWFLRREGTSVRLAAFGAWLYAVHPSLPYAQVSWLTNQMHLAQSLVVLGSLLYWQTARDRRAAWWIPLGASAAVAFLLKEDGIMLLPVLAALTVLRVWILRSEAPRGWLPLAGLAVCLVAGLLTFRQARLGRLGGYGAPELHAMVPNFLKGIESVLFLWPTTRIWQAVASVVAAAAVSVALWLAPWRTGRRALALGGVALAAGLSLNVPAAFHSRIAYSLVAWQGLASGAVISMLAVGAGAALWRGRRAALFLIAAGLAVALGFDLPFALVTKREQYHLVTIGSVLALAGAAQALLDLATRPKWRAAAGVALVAATLPLPLLARHLAGDFLPCARPVLTGDESAGGWWVVPQELKAWLDLKARRCAAGLAPTPIADLPVITWDVHPEVMREEPLSYRWTSERPVALFPRGTGSATLALRRPDASVTRPVRVTVHSSGGTQVVTLDSGEWRAVALSFTPTPSAWLRNAQRVDLRVEPWFVPAARDRGSNDLRRHGVQLRIAATDASEPGSR